jgi:hypothetical protein
VGHNWSRWAVAKIDELLIEVTKTRQCTRCKEKEEKKDRLAIADLKIAYSDDGTNYVEDEYSVDGTGAHSKCSVYFTDYQSLLSGSLNHAVDEEGAGRFPVPRAGGAKEAKLPVRFMDGVIFPPIQIGQNAFLDVIHRIILS